MSTLTKDFFISFNHLDSGWAEWIAWQLEGAGYTTIIQMWDFAAGSNFIAGMDKGLANSKRVIAVLSPNYLQSQRRLQHREEAEKFYRALAGEERKVQVGMEASGQAGW